MTTNDPGQARRPRLVDVAARAGVTVSTASRALNHPEMVRPETRARVLAAAQDLDYEPNRAARGLITGESTAVAMMVPDVSNSHFGRMVRAAQTTARGLGHDLVVVDTGGYGVSEADLLRSTSRIVGGIILCGATRAYRPRPFGVPVVYVNRRARGSHCVLLDPVSLVKDPVEHLVELGHERIDWVAGPKWGWSAASRLRTIERLAAKHDIRILHTVDQDVDFVSGIELAEVYDGRATALVCYTDRQAFGFVGRARELGLRVPEDISVVGAFDAPGGAHFTPPLTTFAVPQEEMASAAVRLLLDDHAGHPDGSDPVITETVQGRLLVRASTAAAPRSARPIGQGVGG